MSNKGKSQPSGRIRQKRKECEMKDKNISTYQQRIGITIDALAEKVRCVVNIAVEKAKITYRVKDPETLRRKILFKRKKGVFSIHDVYGLRVITESVEDAYLVSNKIRESFPAQLVEDFIAYPQALSDPGFEGKTLRRLRLVAYENGVPFEIQITTNDFHEVNESHHEAYRQRRYS